MPHDVYLIGRSNPIRLDSDAHEYSDRIGRHVFLRNGKRIAEMAEERIEAVVEVDDAAEVTNTGLGAVGAKMVG